MNNIIEMKKRNIMSELKNYPISKPDRIDAMLHKKESQDFRRSAWKYLGLFFMFAFLITLGLWAIDVHACNIEEPEPVVIKVTEAL